MDHDHNDRNIQTLSEIASLSQPGEVFTLTFPTKELLFQLLPRITNSIVGKKTVHLFSLHEWKSTEGYSSRIQTIRLPSARTTSKAIDLVRKELRKTKGGDDFVFDIGTAWWGTPKSFDRFFTTVVPLLRKKRICSFWLITEEEMTLAQIRSIRERSDFFLRVWNPSVQGLWCHFLTARRVDDPTQFLPRPLTVEGKSLALGTPAITSSQDSGEGGSGKSPATRDLALDSFEQIFRRSPEGIIIFDLTGDYRRPNRRACEILGYDEKELRACRLADLVDTGSKIKALRGLIELRRTKRGCIDIAIRRKSGRLCSISANAFSLAGDLYACTIRDVTGHQHTISRLTRTADEFLTIFEESPSPQAVFTGRKLVRRNTSFNRSFPWLSSDPSSITLVNVLGNPNARIARELDHLATDTEPLDHPLEKTVAINTPAGERRLFKVMATATRYEGKKGLHCTFEEVTNTVHRVEELTRSEHELHSLVQSSPGCIALIADEKILYANASFLRMLGYADGEVIGSEFGWTVDQKDRATVIAALRTMVRTQENPVRLEYSGLRKDASLVDISADILPGTYSGKSVVFLHARDVSNLREKERALRKETENLEILLEIDLAVGRSLDFAPVAKAGLHAVMKNLRLEMGGFYALDEGRSDLVFLSQENLPEQVTATLAQQNIHEGLTGYVAKTLEPLLLNVAVYPAHLPYRSLFQSEGIKLVACVPCIVHQSLVGIMLLATRKMRLLEPQATSLLASIGARVGQALSSALAYRTLGESEQRYRTAIESVPDVIYHTNAGGHPIYVSPKVEELLGYRPDDFYRNPELWRTSLHPDDRAQYSQRISTHYTGEERFSIEYRILPKGKASYRWVRDSLYYSRDPQGNLVSITGVVSDITERKGLEEALMQSEKLKSDILHSVHEGVAVYDTHLTCIDWNRSMYEITGIRREEVVEKPADKNATFFASEVMISMLQRALSGESVSSEDLSLTGQENEDGGYYWVRCFPLKDQSGLTKGVVAVVTDVTARRALERDVRESEETLRNVIDAMGDALMISDLQGRVWEVNREFSRITGYPRSEVLGMNFPYPWLVDEEMSRFVTWIVELRERNYLRDFDMTWHAKDGRSVAISLNTSLLRNALGEPVAMLNIARDISERRRLIRELVALNAISTSINKSLYLEEVLRVASEQIKEVLNASVVLLYLKDFGGRNLRLECSVGLPSDFVSRIQHLHPSQSATGTVISEGKPLLISKGLLLDSRVTQEGRMVFEALDLRSLGVIPLRSKEKVLGAFDVAFREEHEFTEKEQQFLLLIGAQLGSAIENAQLYAEVRDQVRRLTSLYEVGRGLTGALDAQTILKTVQAEVRKAIPLDRFTYFELSADRNVLRPVLDIVGDQGEVLEAVEIHRQENHPYWEVVKSGTSYYGEAAGVCRGSMMLTPVRSKQEIAGLLVVCNSATSSYNESHLRLLENIANLTEIALDKASLYVDIVNKSKEIESRNKELDDFTYVVSHDLKEPLISIEAYSKILINEYGNTIGDEGKEYLSSVVQSSVRLKTLIDDLLLLSRLGRVGEAVQIVSVEAIIQEVLNDLQFTLKERNVTVHVDKNLPHVRYNPTQLGIVFRNLISNAVKFNTRPAPHVTITVTRGEAENIISVADNGIGIDRQYFEKIFMIFQRLHRSEEYRGTGAGLTIVKRIVEIHRGRIWVESVVGEGSTFSFTIPD